MNTQVQTLSRSGSRNSVVSMEYYHKIDTTSMKRNFVLVLAGTSRLLPALSTVLFPLVAVQIESRWLCAEAVSSGGYVLPPMIIVSDAVLQGRWFTVTIATNGHNQSPRGLGLFGCLR